MYELNLDFIGDIHGHADKLEALLTKMNYQRTGKGFKHSFRKALFLGDYIDRGQYQYRTIEIVRNMVDDGSALALMGNHEFSAVCMATKGQNGYLRPRTSSLFKQKQAFLAEYPIDSDRYKSAINWFKSLPIYLDLGDIGAVHACWDQRSFDIIRPKLRANNSLSDDAYAALDQEGSEFSLELKNVLSGPQYVLPEGMKLTHSHGKKLRKLRFLWWKSSELPLHQRLDLDLNVLSHSDQDRVDRLPLTENFNQHSHDVHACNKLKFIGHYWQTGSMQPMSKRVACLDYSVAKGGKLAAYRYQGEREFNPRHFVCV